MAQRLLNDGSYDERLSAGGGFVALAKITGAGLSAIGLLVIVLWACILGEHLIVQRANRELAGAMTEIRTLQHRKATVPASTPTPQHRVRPAIG